ncbi:hypothetical protein CRYUN_Cryun25bG0082700 [Craigia yunnanensis]
MLVIEESKKLKHDNSPNEMVIGVVGYSILSFFMLENVQPNIFGYKVGIVNGCKKLKWGMSIVFKVENMLVDVNDPYGFRLLVMGRGNGDYLCVYGGSKGMVICKITGSYVTEDALATIKELLLEAVGGELASVYFWANDRKWYYNRKERAWRNSYNTKSYPIHMAKIFIGAFELANCLKGLNAMVAPIEVLKSKNVFMKSSSIFRLSHGLAFGQLLSMGSYILKKINIMTVCSKGMGLFIRRFYAQGKEIKDTKINSSFNFDQVVDGIAIDVALGWLVAFRSLFTFVNTLERECKNDIFGEWGVLLGVVHEVYIIDDNFSTTACPIRKINL